MLHHDVVKTIGLDNVVNANDVLVGVLARDSGLVAKLVNHQLNLFRTQAVGFRRFNRHHAIHDWVVGTMNDSRGTFAKDSA